MSVAPSRAALGRVVAVALFVVVALATPQARADDLDDYLVARDAYLAGEYPLAVTRFELLLRREEAALRAGLRESARSYYAASLFSTNQRDAAVSQLERLLRDNPDAQLNPEQFSPVLMQLFLQTRDRLAAELQQLRGDRAAAQRAASERAEREARALREALGTERVVVRTDRWQAALPLGVGQFLNGDARAGHGFLWSELSLAALATSATLLGWTLPPGPDREPTRVAFHCSDGALCVWSALQVVSFSALGALAIAGSVHGAVTHRPERFELRPRVLSPELQRLRVLSPGSSVSVTPTLGGAALEVRF